MPERERERDQREFKDCNGLDKMSFSLWIDIYRISNKLTVLTTLTA
jgi:hypothetical protein